MSDVYRDCCALVLGTTPAGIAAARLLARLGARVTVESLGGEPGAEAVAALRDAGVGLGATGTPAAGAFDLGVVADPSAWTSPWVGALRAGARPVLSELELGYQQSRCLHLAIAGTNGKSTTASLVMAVLEAAHRRVARAGGDGPPVCGLVEETRDLDFLVVEVATAELMGVRHFRPVVAVLLNWVASVEPWPAVSGLGVGLGLRLFANQQAFDWAVVQSEALAQLRSAGHELPGKQITFSADNRRADLVMDRGLLLSRLEDWNGPLFDLDQGALRGLHFGEDLMAALAVGRVLRVPLEVMVDALRTVPPRPDCCEAVGETGGVRWVNDAASSNPHALQRAVASAPGGAQPNVILIAGGDALTGEYYEVGPLLSRRVRHVFLFGSVAVRLRAAWSLFTPCTLVGSLLEAVERSAEIAAPGDVVLLSPTCPSHGQIGSTPPQGEVFRELVPAVMARRSNRPAEVVFNSTDAQTSHEELSPATSPERGGRPGTVSD